MRDRTGSAAILGRWQPVHLGHQAALHAMCTRFDDVTIGVGSSNIEDYRSPFAHPEIETMLRLALVGFENFRLVPVPDFPDDAIWRKNAIGLLGTPGVFFTANPYVRRILAGSFEIRHPAAVIPDPKKTPISGTQVRRELARGNGWVPLVPPAVAEFMLANGLDERFRSRYGLHTLVMETIILN